MRWSRPTSASRGTLSRINVCSVSRLAIISGSVAFFAPEIGIVPLRGRPPTILMRSMSIPPRPRRGRTAHDDDRLARRAQSIAGDRVIARDRPPPIGTSRPDCGESRERSAGSAVFVLVLVAGRPRWRLLASRRLVARPPARLRLAPLEVFLERRRKPLGPPVALVCLACRHGRVLPRLRPRVPGAAQREAVRRRPGPQGHNHGPGGAQLRPPTLVARPPPFARPPAPVSPLP